VTRTMRWWVSCRRRHRLLSVCRAHGVGD
jgi:hypothetical protein